MVSSDEKGRPRTRRAAVFLRATVSGGLLVLLASRIEWSSLSDSLFEADIVLVGLSQLAFLAVTATEAERLHTVFGAISILRREALRLHVVGAFYATFLPGQLGGELYRLQHLVRMDASVAWSLSLLILMRGIGVATMLVGFIVAVPLTSLSLADLSGSADGARTLVWALGVALLLLVLLVVCYGGRWSYRLLHFFVRARQAMRSLSSGSLIMLVVLSVAVLVLRSVVLYLLVLGTDSRVPLSGALVVTSCATLASTLPISFAGLGVREGTIVGLLALLGTSYESAVLVALLARSVSIPILLWGGLWSALSPIAQTPHTTSGRQTPSPRTDGRLG